MKYAVKGFSLIELMIVIVIIGLLLTVAVPGYRDHVIRGQIAEAKAALSDGRVKMEQFFQDNKTYEGGPCPSATDAFSYACSNQTVTTYTITATGKGTISAYSYTINQANTKASNTPWGNSTSCWVSKKGGGC